MDSQKQAITVYLLCFVGKDHQVRNASVQILCNLELKSYHHPQNEMQSQEQCAAQLT